MTKTVNKLTAAVTLAVFTFLSSGYAQAAEVAHSALDYMPAVGTLLMPGAEKAPPILRGIKIYPDKPFMLDFILDQGDESMPSDALKAESERLLKYFLAGLTIPEKDLWVNLSPYESDRIVPEELGQTDLGKDMLGEDYVLKQLAASLTDPKTELGKAYWNAMYAGTARRAPTSKP